MKRILNEESEMNSNGLASRKPLIDPDDKDNDKDNKIKDEIKAKWSQHRPVFLFVCDKIGRN